MTHILDKFHSKPNRYVIGLMSGTSVDGIDAALVRISGCYTDIKVETIAFEKYDFKPDITERIFNLFNNANSKELCYMNFKLGELFAEAAIKISGKSGVKADLIGSHGQTIYHMPKPLDSKFDMASTLQIGEGAVIAHMTGVTTITDFRAADVAAGGTGAPLVPYTEFLLHRSPTETVLLLNLGGIGNITMIPANASEEEIIAFDTGPGNMIIDYLAKKLYNLDFDPGGKFAAQGKPNKNILEKIMTDPYILLPPPKATGREYFGHDFAAKFHALCTENNMTNEDIMATATEYTAQSVVYSINSFINRTPNKLIVSGGGAYNLTIMNRLKKSCNFPVLTQEDINMDSDAKEAVAFAILANETMFGRPGNLTSVTGAPRKILGKINL